MKEDFLIYSLTTSYVKSKKFQRSHFVHVLNYELVKNGIKVKTITPHSKGLPTREIRDGVLINRFRYLPEKLQLNELTLPEVIGSKIGRMKIFFLV